MTDDVLPFVVLGLVVVATLVLVAAVAWSLGVLRQPRALVQSGHWREAGIAAERLRNSWLRIFPSVRDEAAHARAACLHLEGKLEESLAALRTLRGGGGRGRGHLADAIALLEGANLVMVGGDAHLAVARLTTACGSPRSSPEDLVFLALAKHGAGDLAGAESTFAEAPLARPKGAPSPRIYEPAFHYLRGLYLMKTGRPEEAAADLEAAAASPITTIYVERARALSPRASADDGDGRASLAPQVIDE